MSKNDGGSLDFRITLDDSEARRQAESFQGEIRKLEKVASSSGAEMDAMLKSISSGFQTASSASASSANNIGLALAQLDKTLISLDSTVGKVGADLSSSLQSATKDTEPLGRSSEEAGKKATEAFKPAKKAIKELADEAKTAAPEMESAFSRVGQVIAATFGTTALLGFARSIVQVRADMQGLEASFTTLLGSGQKAKAMLSELTRFGAETPMDLSDLARASQLMLSFGVEGEKVVPIIKQLGDISGGSGEKMQSLALAFSQMSSTGRLMGQDLNQMINAGFNPLAEISRTTGRSMAELKQDMEAGAISIDLVEGALKSATSAGGLFFGNLDAQSKTLRGQLGALSDAYEQMLNGIGQQTEGAIGAGINLATKAVENWETLARAIFGVVTAVGAYKTVLLATVALDKARAASAWIAEARQLEALIGAQGVAMVQKQGLTIGTQAYTLALRQQFVAQQAALGVTVSEAQLTAISTASKATATAATGALSTAKTTLTAVTARLNAVLMANPYAVAAAAVAALAYGIYELVTYESEAEASARRLKESHADAVREFEGEKLVLQDLYNSLKDAKKASDDSSKSQKEHNEALATYAQKKEELIKRAPQAVSALIKERLEVDDLAGAYKILTEEVRKSIMARHREQAIKDLGDDFFKRDKEGYVKIREVLQLAYGKEVGSSQFLKVRSAIEKGQPLRPEFIRQLKENLSRAGAWQSEIFNFTEEVYKLRLSQQSKEDKIKLINDLYGDLPEEAKRTTQALGNVSDAAKKAKESYSNAMQRIAGIRSGAVKVKAGEEAKAIEELKKQAEESAKAYETLTGKSLKAKSGASRGGGAKSNPNHELAERKQRDIDLKLLEEKTHQDEQARLLRQQEERISTMQDGWEKEEAILKLKAEKRKAAYQKMEQDLIEAERTEARKRWEQSTPKAKDKGEVFDPTTITRDNLGKSAQDILAEQERIHREQERQEQEAYWRKVIEGVESYEQRRLRIQEDYARRREALYQHNDKGERTGYHDGITADNERELNRKESEALSALDLEIAQRSESFKAWMETVASLSLDQLSRALEVAKTELAKLKDAPGVSSESLVEAQAKVDQLSKSLDKATARDKVAPEKRSIKEWKDLSDTIDKGAKSFDDLGNAIGGTAGKILQGVGAISTATFGAINSVVQLAQVSAGAMTATASSAASAVQKVEKASLILSVITTALTVAQKIASLFNSDQQKDEEIKRLQSRIDTLQWEIDHSSTIQLEKSVNSYQTLQQAIEESRKKLGEYNGSLFDAGRAVEYINRRTDAAALHLASVYEKVAYSANKAVGADKYQNARAQLKAMAEQQLAISQQIGREGKKKKKDYGKIDEYKRKISELGEKQVEIINKLTDDVMGGSFDKLSSELGDAIASAFSRGEDAAEAFNAKVSDLMRDLVKRQLTEQLLMKPMLEIFDRYKERFARSAFDPGKIVGLTGELSRDLKSVGDKVVPAYTAAMKEVESQLRSTLGAGETARQATKRGIATASQESVDENNGLLRSIQGLTSEIQADLRGLRSIASDQLRHLSRIDENTAHLKAMSGDLHSLQRSVADIETRGVRIKD